MAVSVDPQVCHMMSHVSNAHRIAWIDAQIRAHRHPNVPSIAERFEISRRQAARDIEYLRYTMSAPIAYSAKHNGYAYTDVTYALPAVVVSAVERGALTFLAQRYRSLSTD